MTTSTSEKTRRELFRYEDGGVCEYHAVCHVTDGRLSFAGQADALATAIRELKKELPGASVVFGRLFVSDAANQVELLRERLGDIPTEGAWSVVEQPPLDGTKVVAWVYLLTEMTLRSTDDGFCEAEHGAYRHLWSAGWTRPGVPEGSECQMRQLLEDYAEGLERRGCRLADDAVRTWLFVRDVDADYAGVVKGRNEVFALRGLTKETHFIASTGIGGRQADPKVRVTLDGYAVDGLQREQTVFLQGRSHLNATIEYGVSFERGTAVDYGDRRQVFISGTASIGNRGEVLHRGDVLGQTERMWENVGVLLAEAGCGWNDVGHMLVYLRDGADYAVVKERFDERFPDVPKVFVLAPVCRPGWLIEMECMAVKRTEQTEWPVF